MSPQETDGVAWPTSVQLARFGSGAGGTSHYSITVRVPRSTLRSVSTKPRSPHRIPSSCLSSACALLFSHPGNSVNWFSYLSSQEQRSEVQERNASCPRFPRSYTNEGYHRAMSTFFSAPQYFLMKLCEEAFFPIFNFIGRTKDSPDSN